MADYQKVKKGQSKATVYRILGRPDGYTTNLPYVGAGQHSAEAISYSIGVAQKDPKSYKLSTIRISLANGKVYSKRQSNLGTK